MPTIALPPSRPPIAAGVSRGPTTSPGGSRLTAYPVVGRPIGDGLKPKGPATLLMGGGTDVVEAFAAARKVLVGKAPGRAGDVVVLRATGDNAYDQFLYDQVPFSSVRTIRIDPGATPADLKAAAKLIDKAHFVFFAGGDQGNYVRWKGSPLIAAVDRLRRRGGIVGGTSAGCAIMGGHAYDGIAHGQEELSSAEAMENPESSKISFTEGLFRFLPNVVTDTHFHQKDRFGRLASFLARESSRHPGEPAPLGVGVDQATALVVDHKGVATLVDAASGGGAAYFLKLLKLDSSPGQPLRCTLEVQRLDRSGQSFDLRTGAGNGTTYQVRIDANGRPPYSVNPY